MERLANARIQNVFFNKNNEDLFVKTLVNGYKGKRLNSDSVGHVSFPTTQLRVLGQKHVDGSL